MSDNTINKIIQNNYKIGEDNIPKVEENTNEDIDVFSINYLLYNY